MEREFKIVSSRRAFGLNFERHRPEAVELPQRPVRKGDKVRVLPERGSTELGDQRLWRVTAFAGTGEKRTARLALVNSEPPASQEVPVADCVVVAEFRDVIYPGLVSTGSVERGGDKPFHTVINGENFHVLEALTYTHKGKIDCIYIDPPYNTGAKDWKYNNDYVEADDLYRHSKWLAMMERRLTVARQLLKPEDSVLIVTIDEKEYLRLGLLLEQCFQDGDIQMITSVINPKGSARTGRFSRTDEYLYFVFLGQSRVSPWNTDMIRDAPEGSKALEVRWAGLMRNGEGSDRQRIPSLFYPIHVDKKTGAFHSVGEPLDRSQPSTSYVAPEGTLAIFPVDRSGREMMWRLHPPTLRRYLECGYAKFGKRDPATGRRSPSYLQSGIVSRIEAGSIEVVGRDAEGAVVLRYLEGQKVVSPMTLWNRTSHSASEHGAGINKRLIPGRKFPYPKSLYAVEDALRFAVRDKPDATVLDFFAGSGTTAHAVMRLNKQDGGRRQCVSVTNNEVSSEEQTQLRKQGLRQGDPEWEQRGICDYITKPRLQAALTGLTPEGQPIEGEYRFTDQFPIGEGFQENAEFFTLTYEAPVAVGHNKSFARIAPLLWLRAGSKGRRIDSIPKAGWDVADAYGVLVDLDTTTPFCNAVKKSENVRLVYIVTDDDRRYQSVIRRLPSHVETVRLYESYLSNFRINLSE